MSDARSRLQKSITETLRWIVALPAWFIAMPLVGAFFILTVSRAYYSLDDLWGSEGFAGHWILGPIAIGTRSSAQGVFSMLAFAYTLPRAKRELSLLLCGLALALVLSFLVLSSYLWYLGEKPFEHWLRSVLETVPWLAASILVAWNIDDIWKKDKGSTEPQPAVVEFADHDFDDEDWDDLDDDLDDGEIIATQGAADRRAESPTGAVSDDLIRTANALEDAARKRIQARQEERDRKDEQEEGRS